MNSDPNCEGRRKDDELYRRACEHVTRTRHASISNLQREFRIGYNQASRWLVRMEENGVIKIPRKDQH